MSKSVLPYTWANHVPSGWSSPSGEEVDLLYEDHSPADGTPEDCLVAASVSGCSFGEFPSGVLYGQGDPLPTTKPDNGTTTIPVDELELPPGTLHGQGKPLPAPPGDNHFVPVDELELPPGTLCTEVGPLGQLLSGILFEADSSETSFPPLYPEYKYISKKGFHDTYVASIIERTEKGYFEVELLEVPSYRGRADDAHTSHRITSDRNTQIICVAENKGAEPKTHQEALNLFTTWADLSSDYIATGKTLDQQIKARHSSKAFRWFHSPWNSLRESVKGLFDFKLSDN